MSSPAYTKTASRCVTETATGTHTFEIVGYTLKKGIGIGKFFRSATFSVGGYDWAIYFYPDGITEAKKDYVSAFLWLVSKEAEVNVRFSIGFVIQQRQPPQNFLLRQRLFKSSEDKTRVGMQIPSHILRCVLEEPGMGYIHDDRVTIRCQLNVIGTPHLSGTNGESEIEVPPCDITDHFGKLLTHKEGADITISVAGHSFEAHKIVLAARSPVFRAELYGQMKERGAQHLTVEDMQPAVFGALLHFIYNDSLPDMSDLQGSDDYDEMMRHLLVAADRYAMERLKLICQSIIRKTLDVDNVSTTLALADQHHCDKLKTACIEFIVASSKNLDAVKATQGYASLKRTCPSAFVELFEQASNKHCRT